ncbi:glycosyltransferase family 4 protein [Leptolyngbya sp. AN03gr2]|uniref:glycosyltransferase family 4 protein n=1 Tax=unclassified Leptolyngbya TaxID=2650499 RepID=UPI003D31B8B5
MKVLLLHDYGTAIGGAELMMLALRDGLRQRGHDARLFTTRAEGTGMQADYDCFGTTSRYRTLLQTANPWAFWRLRQVLAEFQPDVVHVRMFLTQLSPLILPLLKPFRSLYHLAWYRPICPIGTKMLPDGTACTNDWGKACLDCLPVWDWSALMLQMNLWQHWRDAFNLIVANSGAVKQQLISQGISPIEVVWNGIPVRPVRPALTSPPTVVFAGRLVPEKGIDLLLSAFAKVVQQIPEARLLIAGDGAERDRILSLIYSLNLHSNVSLLGHLSRSDLEQAFSTAWVQVVPSRWAEPFGIVAAEAMMRGTAVIASRAGGLAEIVRDGQTGFLVPPGEVEPLAEALLKVLQNRELAEQMGHTGRTIALSQFSEGAFVDRFIELYQQLLQNSAHFNPDWEASY